MSKKREGKKLPGLGKGRVATRSKAVASVRIWRRKQRSDLWYCTIRLPDSKPVVRSCRRRIRASAEEFAHLLLRRLMNGDRTTTEHVHDAQLELPPLNGHAE